MTGLAARLPLRARRTQATRLHSLKPASTRLRQRPRSTWWRELGNLLGGVVLVIAAVYLGEVLPW